MNAALVPFIAALFVFGGLYTYTICEQRHRANWQTRAPKHIRRTALWSIYMGQMALPGGLLGLYGMLVGIGVVSIPGMILAIRIWRLAYAMLRRDPNAAQEARKLHRFAVVLNFVAIAAGVVLVAVWPGEEMVALALTLAGYGAISFAHAEAMLRCAELLEAQPRVEDAESLGAR